MMAPPLFEHPGTVARRLGVPEKWLEQEAREGRVPCLFVGRRLFCHREEIERALIERARTNVAATAEAVAS